MNKLRSISNKGPSILVAYSYFRVSFFCPFSSKRLGVVPFSCSAELEEKMREYVIISILTDFSKGALCIQYLCTVYYVCVCGVKLYLNIILSVK